MSNTQQAHATASVVLSKQKKTLVTLGCMLIMFTLALVGGSLAICSVPYLTKLDAFHTFTLIATISALSSTIMTPIGGKLGDLFGRRNVIVISAIIAVVSIIIMGLFHSVVLFAGSRFFMGLATGGMTAAPYIIMREINEPKDVPRGMGLLSSSLAVGGFGGAIVAGFLLDKELMGLALMFPAVFFVVAIALIGPNLPNTRREGKVKLDVPGIILLAVLLGSFFLSMNLGAKIGWTNPYILMGFATAIVSGILFVMVENKAEEPVVPLRLLKNGKYTMLLFVGMACYFYFSANGTYSVVAAQKVLNVSNTVAGSLTLPRTIITMILPAFVGVWVGKSRDNLWKAMAISTCIITIAFLPLAFMTQATAVALMFVCIAATGFAESFRAVSVTPTLQTFLTPKDLGIGTALGTFANTLGMTFATTVNGIIFDMNGDNIVKGINMIFGLTTVVSILGFLAVIFFVRKFLRADAK